MDFGDVLQNLLHVHVELAQCGGSHGAAIGFVVQQRHALLHAERLQDGLRNAKSQIVERPGRDDAVVAFFKVVRFCGTRAQRFMCGVCWPLARIKAAREELYSQFAQNESSQK